MKVCIYGAGAIGGYLGVMLKRGGADVSLIARGAHLDAIRNDIGQVGSHIAAETVKLVTGDAVVVLEYLLTVTCSIAHRCNVGGLGALGVHVRRIEHEGRTEGAEYGSMVYGSTPVTRRRRTWGYIVTKLRSDGLAKNLRNSPLFRTFLLYIRFLRNIFPIFLRFIDQRTAAHGP